MSTTASPFGLRPSYHPSGYIRPKVGVVASAYANNIFQYSPVAITTDGSLILAAAGARAIGAFMGVEYTPTNGRRVYSNTWPANQVATEINAAYTDDPWITYTIQANGTVGQTNLGNQADWTANTTASGNTVTGLSTVALDIATLTAVGSAGMRIVGLTPGPDNAYGDTFTIVDVQISKHQNVADLVAYG